MGTEREEEEEEEEEEEHTMTSSSLSLLHSRKHVEFIKNSSLDTETIEYALTEHLRLSGMYWGLTAHKLLVMNKNNQEEEEDKEDKEDKEEIMSKEDVMKFINECYDEKSSLFAGAPGHDGHLLCTLSAIQIFVLYECVQEQLSEERAKKICMAISKLQSKE